MINMCNHGHIPYISLFVHHNTDLIYSEVHLEVESIPMYNSNTDLTVMDTKQIVPNWKHKTLITPITHVSTEPKHCNIHPLIFTTQNMAVPSPDEKGGGLEREYSTLPVKLTWAGAVQPGSLLHRAERWQPLHHASADGQSPTH
jgi:hypothetical protein